jgi:hypothetical protein
MNLKIDHLRASIAHQRMFIERHVVVNQSKELSNLRYDMLAEFRKLQDLRISARIEFQRARAVERDRRRDRIQLFLGAINSHARHEDAIKLRHDATGEWLLRDARFQQWFSPEGCTDPLLWLNGIPGAGMFKLGRGMSPTECNVR